MNKSEAISKIYALKEKGEISIDEFNQRIKNIENGNEDEDGDKNDIDTKKTSPSGIMVFLRIGILIFLFFYSYSMGSIPSNQLNQFGKIISLSFFIVAPLLYFYPTIEAVLRKKVNLTSIAALNIFLGWTLIGWVVALVWSLSKDVIKKEEITVVENIASPKESSDLPEKLEKLFELKQKGILTDEEFNSEKKKILSE